MISDGIFSRLANSARIQAIVGLPATRQDKSAGSFYNLAPEEADSPMIVFSQVSAVGSGTMDGPEALMSARWQFSCYSIVAREAKALARAVRFEFEGYQGKLSDGTEVDVIAFSSEVDLFDPAPKLHHVPIDLDFIYRDVGTI
jgi:Protein of unknown function (DUF3168)